jgi:hypothetical protein
MQMRESLIKQFISDERFGSYESLDEYIVNLIVSKNAYIPLSVLEVALRNSIDRFLSDTVGSQWYENEIFLTKDGIKKVEEAKNILQSRREEISKNKVIAELSLGFWVNLFKKPYDKKMRINDLKKIFPNLPHPKEQFINREIIFKELNRIRNFRNRIFHHEKVINKDNYKSVQNEIFQILRYFDAEIYNLTKKINGYDYADKTI